MTARNCHGSRGGSIFVSDMYGPLCAIASISYQDNSVNYVEPRHTLLSILETCENNPTVKVYAVMQTRVAQLVSAQVESAMQLLKAPDIRWS